MELRVDIDEADVGTVKVGNKAAFTVEAYQGRRFPAEIAELRYAPQTIDGVVTYQAVLSIDNTELLFLSNVTATAEIIVESIADALLVPNAALRFAPPAEPEDPEGGGGGLLGLLIPRPPGEPASMPAASPADGSRTIWILRDGAPVSVEVRAGATDGLMTVILEGSLEEGTAVITDLAGGG
jgi:HlyD family secretion protein